MTKQPKKQMTQAEIDALFAPFRKPARRAPQKTGFKHSMEHYGKLYGRCRNTMRRIAADGVNLDDPEAVRMALLLRFSRLRGQRYRVEILMKENRFMPG